MKNDTIFKRNFTIETNDWSTKKFDINLAKTKNVFVFANGGIGKSFYAKNVLKAEKGFKQIDPENFLSIKPCTYFDGWDEIGTPQKRKILNYISANNIEGVVIFGRKEGLIPGSGDLFIRVKMNVDVEDELKNFPSRLVDYAKRIDEKNYLNILKNNSPFRIYKDASKFSADDHRHIFISFLALKMALSGRTKISKNVALESLRVFNLNNNTHLVSKNFDDTIINIDESCWFFEDKTIQSVFISIFLINNLDIKNTYFNGFSSANEISYLNEAFDIIHIDDSRTSKKIIDFFEMPLMMKNDKATNYLVDWSKLYRKEELFNTIIIINSVTMLEGRLVMTNDIAETLPLDFIKALMIIPQKEFFLEGAWSIANYFFKKISKNSKTFYDLMKNELKLNNVSEMMEFIKRKPKYRCYIFPYFAHLKMKRSDLKWFLDEERTFGSANMTIFKAIELADNSPKTTLKWMIKNNELKPKKYYGVAKKNKALKYKIEKNWLLKNDATKNKEWIAEYVETGEFTAEELIKFIEKDTTSFRFGRDTKFPENMKIKFDDNKWDWTTFTRLRFIWSKNEIPEKKPKPKSVYDKLEIKQDLISDRNLDSYLYLRHNYVQFKQDFREKSAGIWSFIGPSIKSKLEEIMKEKYNWWYVDYVLQLFSFHFGSGKIPYCRKFLRLALKRLSGESKANMSNGNFELSSWYIDYVEKYGSERNLEDTIDGINENNVTENYYFWFIYSNPKRNEYLNILKTKSKKAYIVFIAKCFEGGYNFGSFDEMIPFIDLENKEIKNSVIENIMKSTNDKRLYPSKAIYAIKNIDIFNAQQRSVIINLIDEIFHQGMEEAALFNGGSVPVASEYWGTWSRGGDKLIEIINTGNYKIKDSVIKTFSKILKTGESEVYKIGSQMITMLRRQDVMDQTNLLDKIMELKIKYPATMTRILDLVDGDHKNYGSMEFKIANYYSYLNHSISENEFIKINEEVIQKISLICKDNYLLKEKKIQEIIHKEMVRYLFANHSFIWHREFTPFLRKKAGWVDFSVSYNSIYSVIELKNINDDRFNDDQYKTQIIKYDKNYRKVISKTLLIYGKKTNKMQEKVKRIKDFISTTGFNVIVVWG